MTDTTTWLPVQVGSNARWVPHSWRDELAQPSEYGGVLEDLLPPFGNPSAGDPLTIFPTVPDDELWVFERLVLQAHSVEQFAIRLFLDNDKTASSSAATDYTMLVDGVWPAMPIEVLAPARPLQVPGGYRLGVLWARISDGVWVSGTARAQIASYRRG